VAGPDGYGELHPDALALADGADLLVHDAHLLPEEIVRRPSATRWPTTPSVWVGRPGSGARCRSTTARTAATRPSTPWGAGWGVPGGPGIGDPPVSRPGGGILGR
jgi:hypothetical protein